ncbi:MAG: GGDEF domain-containing protein [Coprococcus catus]|nr:GGDEF domain-containing protein [Coprococcus catus]
MNKICKFLTLIILIVVVLLFGIYQYRTFIQTEIYQENSEHLLATYEQVNRTFTLFTQRNWNVLSDWDEYLQCISDSENTETVWHDFADRKNNWQYSDFYMFNEHCDFLTANNRKGTADSIQNCFQEMYSSGCPTISDYTASSGKHKVVFAIPLSHPFCLNNITYTGVAVSYDVTTVEDMISNNVYGDKSSCYLVNAKGHVILSLESQSEFLSEQENLFTFLKDNAIFSENTYDAVEHDLQKVVKGRAKFNSQRISYYMVYQPVGLNDWSILGIVRTAAVNSQDEKIMHVTIAAITVLATCLLLLLLRLSSLNAEYKLKHQELLHQALKAQKEQTDQLFYGMTCIVDRYTVVDLLKDRYEYHEYSSNSLYPETGSYQNLLDTVARNYIVLSDTENIKISHLLNKEYLQKVLHKGNGIMKIEYSKRTENVYKIMNVVAVEWDEAGIPQKVMMISQDIGKRHELENLANTDGLTGLFNERYFSSVLHRKEQKKLPFVLYYLDLDHFKPVNDTYGHDMGDKLLKAVAERLLKCIRSNDFAFRIGGDEFALIISAEMEDSLCMQTKMRIVQSLLLPYEIDGKTLHIGASCGYAVYPLETEDTGKIRILADQRMYAEKKENHRKAAESQSKDPSPND